MTKRRWRCIPSLDEFRAFACVHSFIGEASQGQPCMSRPASDLETPQQFTHNRGVRHCAFLVSCRRASVILAHGLLCQALAPTLWAFCRRKGSRRFRPPAGRSGMVAPSIPRVNGDSFWQFLQPQSRSSISVLLWVTDPLDLSSCVKHAVPADTAQGTQHLLLPAQRAHSPVQPRVYVRLSIQMVPHLHGRQAVESRYCLEHNRMLPMFLAACSNAALRAVPHLVYR